MILTEDDAKRRQCQETFCDSTNRHTCVASDCMAWRWHSWNLDPDDRHRVSGKAGYCGKAGVPS